MKIKIISQVFITKCPHFSLTFLYPKIFPDFSKYLHWPWKIKFFPDCPPTAVLTPSERLLMGFGFSWGRAIIASSVIFWDLDHYWSALSGCQIQQKWGVICLGVSLLYWLMYIFMLLFLSMIYLVYSTELKTTPICVSAIWRNPIMS